MGDDFITPLEMLQRKEVMCYIQREQGRGGPLRLISSKAKGDPSTFKV